MSTVWLVAGREITTRTRSRAYRIGLLVTLVLIAVGVSLPGLLGGGAPHVHVGFGADVPPAVRTLVAAETRARGAQLTVEPVADAAAASAAVRDGHLDAALVGGRLYAGSADDAVVAVVQHASATATTAGRLTAAGLSDQQTRAALTVTPLPLATVDSAQTTQRQVIATATIVFFFAQLITFCSWVGSGVVEEKTSRVVELLLGAVRPVQLLTGKVLGIGAVAVAQAVLVGAVALIAAELAGSLSLPASVYGTVAFSVLWFVLAFAFFATVAAALASLVSQQEELGGTLTPLTLLLFLAYAGSFAAASSPHTVLARLASIVPPFSALAMPGRLARGGVPPWEVGLAIVLMLVATAAVLVAGARVYRASILHTGTKLSLARAWRAEPVAAGR